MTPIVNGLEEQYSDQVAFMSYNARDGADGEAIFRDLNLPGHPSFVIFTAAGEEIYRAQGIIEETVLQQQIDAALEAQ
ncbi:MAG: hypothetical protein KC708_16315 [Anaerolineae bacterium]|nr:hypothetical protein [Anaerolineae bacterium]